VKCSAGGLTWQEENFFVQQLSGSGIGMHRMSVKLNVLVRPFYGKKKYCTFFFNALVRSGSLQKN
jgi:hypothetical protein